MPSNGNRKEGHPCYFAKGLCRHRLLIRLVKLTDLVSRYQKKRIIADKPAPKTKMLHNEVDLRPTLVVHGKATVRREFPKQGVSKLVSIFCSTHPKNILGMDNNIGLPE
ncbi:hypothetical protein Trydic_g18365 [Trypoxylus dichotomus]